MLNFITFEGRSNRANYFFYMVLINIIGLLSSIVIRNANNTFITIILVAFNVFVGVRYLCISIQRFHDIERSGYHYWLLFIPIYNIYLNIILLFKKGTVGLNRFGDDPLAQESE